MQIYYMHSIIHIYNINANINTDKDLSKIHAEKSHITVKPLLACAWKPCPTRPTIVQKSELE